jgi:hypothetical protein
MTAGTPVSNSTVHATTTLAPDAVHEAGVDVTASPLVTTTRTYSGEIGLPPRQ